jgi:hypothetical protein
MAYQYLKSVFCVALVASIFAPSVSWAQTAGAAGSFAVVGGAGVHFNGAGSTINGDVGIDPAAATFITGHPGNATILPPFANHGNDAFAIAAAAAAQILYDSAAMAPAGGVVTGANLSTSGPTANGLYPPGKYFVSVGTAIIPTSITLTTPGLYIFTLNSDLTASVGSNVILGAGVDPCNVWWRVPTQAALNGTTFVGNVVSNAGISLGVGATLTGRAMTTDPGQVTFAGTNTVTGCASAAPSPTPPAGCPAIGVTPSALPFGEVGTPYSQQLAGNSGTAPYTYLLVEPSGTLPAGLTLSAAGLLSGTPTTSTDQTFVIRVTDTLGCFTNIPFAFVFGINVPTLPQMFVLILALGLLAAGYFRLRRPPNPFAGGTG